ncbi:MAG: hypothetical protein ABIC95_06055 [archaeon]
MSLFRLYKKREGTVNQQMEDFLTESIVLLCDASIEFKDFYIHDFLGIQKTRCEELSFIPQDRITGGVKNFEIPDLVFYLKDKPFCVCEHKIMSGLSGIDQLKRYKKRYEEAKHYYIITSEANKLKELGWQTLYWESLSEKIRQHNWKECNPMLDSLIESLLDLLEKFNLDFPDFNKDEEIIWLEFNKHVIDSVKRYFSYRYICKNMLKNLKAGLRDFIEHGEVYVHEDNGVLGFWGQLWEPKDNESYFQQIIRKRSNGRDIERFKQISFLKLKKKATALRLDMDLLGLNSEEEFKRRFDDTYEQIKQFYLLFGYIIKQVILQLKGVLDLEFERRTISSLEIEYYDDKFINRSIVFLMKEKKSERSFEVGLDQDGKFVLFVDFERRVNVPHNYIHFDYLNKHYYVKQLDTTVYSEKVSTGPQKVILRLCKELKKLFE